RTDSLRVCSPNGPNPRVVPQTAIPDNSGIVVATPVVPNLKAVHRRKGTIRCSKGKTASLGKNSPSKMIAEATVNDASSNKPSPTCLSVHRRFGLSSHVSKSGDTTRAPTPSPNHQVSQSGPKLDQDAAPPRQR